jgi:hypothetical protein
MQTTIVTIHPLVVLLGDDAFPRPDEGPAAP